MTSTSSTGAGHECHDPMETVDVILDTVVLPQPTVVGHMSLLVQEDGPLISVGRRDVGGVGCLPPLITPVLVPVGHVPLHHGETLQIPGYTLTIPTVGSESLQGRSVSTTDENEFRLECVPTTQT